MTLVAVGRWGSVVLAGLEALLALAAVWCASRLGNLRCGPEPPDPHTGFLLLLGGAPLAMLVVTVVLTRRAFVARTGAAAGAAFGAALLGCLVAAGATVFATLLALSC